MSPVGAPRVGRRRPAALPVLRRGARPARDGDEGPEVPVEFL
jgi:hypothetical protein